MNTLLRDDIVITNPERLILTIYTGQEHFSFSLFDPDETCSFLYEELTGDNQEGAFSVFKEAFFNNNFFSLPFQEVWIMNRTPFFTFIPNSIFKEKHREDFMQFLLSDQQGITLHNKISDAGFNILYQLPEDIYNFMLRSFSEPNFIHYSVPLIKYFLEKVKNINNRRMVVNLLEKGLDIFCFSGKTFLLGNYFPCNGLSEVLYYILFIWKQLQFNQLNDYLYITGDLIFREELVDNLGLYIQQIFHMTIPPTNHFVGVETQGIPFELAALSLCEL